MKSKEAIEEQQVRVGNFIASFNEEKKQWLYKSDFKKGTKILKQHLHDLPRYKLVVQMENSFKKTTDKFLSNMTLDVVKKIKQLVKEK